jgi:hypothetical protein
VVVDSPIQSGRPQLIAFLIYLAVVLITVGLPVMVSPSSRHVGFGPDPSVMMWCLVWWPHAIGQGVNPFISHAIWAPTGYNLTWSTSIPGLALAFWPVTRMYGPIVAYNFAALLAPALSALAAFALCRKLTGNFAAALVGGGLYGFSPYEIGHVIAGHLSFTFNFAPPLCVLLFVLLLDGSIARLKFVVVLALLLLVQCLVSNEVLATMTITGAAALIVGFTFLPAERRKIRAALGPVATGYLLAAIMLAPFLYFALANNAAPRQPLFPASYFSTDLLSLVLPTELLLFAPSQAVALTSKFTGNVMENEFYLGLPMLLLLGWFFWSRRYQPVVSVLLVLLLVVNLAALGPVLHVAGHPLRRLPWAAIFDLPLVKYALPVRFANYAFLLVAIIVSICWARPDARLGRMLALYGMAALLPNPLLLLHHSRYDQPPFFSANLYREVLHPGENIMTFPYGVNGPSMLWQAESGMYFSMSGGYIGTTPYEFARWPAVNSALFSLPLADSETQLQSFLSAHRVEAIVVADGAAPPPISFRIKPIRIGGVSVYPIAPSPKPTAPVAKLDRLEEAAAEQWTENLLRAAIRFVDNGGKLADLNPSRLHELGWLPGPKWAKRFDLVLAGTSHGAITGLWIGPGPESTLALGLFTSSGVAAALASRYRKGATEILYPYPASYRPDTVPTGELNFMFMTLRSEFVRRVLRINQSVTARADPRLAMRLQPDTN